MKVKKVIKEVYDSPNINIKVDEDLEVIIINGCPYTKEFFCKLGVGGLRTNVPFVIKKRVDGVITLSEYLPK